MKPLPQRKSPRLKGYDYSQNGAYFITICTHERAHLFGDVVNSEMSLTELGEFAYAELMNISSHWRAIDVDLFVVMPNHVHLIIVIIEPQPLKYIIGGYKAGITRLSNYKDGKIWQRGYHDHIIRNEESLNKIREYIINNPAQWQQDTFFSDL